MQQRSDELTRIHSHDTDQVTHVMITGARGLIGSHLAQHLLRHTADTAGLDSTAQRFAQAHLHLVEHSRPEQSCIVDDLETHGFKEHQEFTRYRADVTCKEGIGQLFTTLAQKGIRLHALIHLAWYYDFCGNDHPRYARCVKGIRDLYQLFCTHSVAEASFIFAGSMASLAPSRDGAPLDEHTPNQPAWPYPQSKVDAADLLRGLCKERLDSRPVIEVVLAAVYTDWCELVPLYQHIERIRNGGPQTWFYPGRLDRGLAYLHVEDACTALRLLLSYTCPKEERCHRFIIGEEQATTNAWIFSETQRLLDLRYRPHLRVPGWIAKLGSVVLSQWALVRGKKPPFVQAWMVAFAEEHFPLNTSKLRDCFGWQPERRMQKDLPRMIRRSLACPKDWYGRNEQRPWRYRE